MSDKVQPRTKKKLRVEIFYDLSCLIGFQQAMFEGKLIKYMYYRMDYLENEFMLHLDSP